MRNEPRHARTHRTAGVIAIEWDRCEVRAVEAELRGARVVLRRAVAASFDSESEASDAGRVVERLRARLDDAVARSCVVVAAREAAVVKQLSLPPAPPEELPQMVQFQAQRNMGVSADEAVLDFAPLPPAAAVSDGQSVLVAALNRPAFDRYGEVTELLGARAVAMPLRPFAVAQFVADETDAPSAPAAGRVEAPRQPPDSGSGEMPRLIAETESGEMPRLVAEATPPPEPQPDGLPAVLVVDFTQGSAELTAVTGGRVFFTRSARCAERLRGGELDVDGLVQEIRRTLAAIGTQFPRCAVRRIVVAGDEDRDRALAGTIHLRTDVPTEVLDPLSAVEPPTPAADVDVLLANRGRFAALVGALVMQARAASAAPSVPLLGKWRRQTGTPAPRDDGGIDFLHPRRPPVKKNLRARYAVLGAVAAVVLLASPIIWYRSEMAARDRRIAALEDSVESFDERLQEAAPMQETAGAVAGWADEEVVWLDELRAFAGRFPDTQAAYLNRLTMLIDTAADQGKIHFEAFARDRETIGDFLETLALESGGRYEVRSRGVQSSTNARFPERFEAEVSVVRPFGADGPEEPQALAGDPDTEASPDAGEAAEPDDADGADANDPALAEGQEDEPGRPVFGGPGAGGGRGQFQFPGPAGGGGDFGFGGPGRRGRFGPQDDGEDAR